LIEKKIYCDQLTKYFQNRIEKRYFVIEFGPRLGHSVAAAAAAFQRLYLDNKIICVIFLDMWLSFTHIFFVVAVLKSPLRNCPVTQFVSYAFLARRGIIASKQYVKYR